AGDALVLATGSLVWLVTPYLLLAGRIPYRSLLPTAILTAVTIDAFGIASTIYMPNAMNTSAQRYGLVGVAFTFVSWLIGLGVAIVITAAVGAVTAERFVPPPGVQAAKGA